MHKQQNEKAKYFPYATKKRIGKKRDIAMQNKTFYEPYPLAVVFFLQRPS